MHFLIDFVDSLYRELLHPWATNSHIYNITPANILEHVILFDPYSFAVKTVPSVYSLFPGI